MRVSPLTRTCCGTVDELVLLVVVTLRGREFRDVEISEATRSLVAAVNKNKMASVTFRFIALTFLRRSLAAR
jgi:hypothetical protein